MCLDCAYKVCDTNKNNRYYMSTQDPYERKNNAKQKKVVAILSKFCFFMKQNSLCKWSMLQHGVNNVSEANLTQGHKNIANLNVRHWAIFRVTQGQGQIMYFLVNASPKPLYVVTSNCAGAW